LIFNIVFIVTLFLFAGKRKIVKYYLKLVAQAKPRFTGCPGIAGSYGMTKNGAVPNEDGAEHFQVILPVWQRVLSYTRGTRCGF
jgi:hypothetical protein